MSKVQDSALPAVFPTITIARMFFVHNANKAPPLIWDVKEVKCPLQTKNQLKASVCNAFKQPKASHLLLIEVMERFGYYGLQGIMAVYLVKQLGMSEADQLPLFSSFSALVYGLVAIGGWLGDKVRG
ncbi:hypothetical protein ACVXHA_23770 [Escherichia coli]